MIVQMFFTAEKAKIIRTEKDEMISKASRMQTATIPEKELWKSKLLYATWEKVFRFAFSLFG